MPDVQLDHIDLGALLLLLDKLDTSALEARGQDLVLGGQDPGHGAVQVRGMLDLVVETLGRLVVHLADPRNALFMGEVVEDNTGGLRSDLTEEVAVLFIVLGRWIPSVSGAGKGGGGRWRILI